MIDGVLIHPLKQIPDERGKVMHMMRADDPHFETFGEIYFSVIYPGVIKGWHLHSRMIIHYAVPVGRIKLVLFDQRADSPSRGQLMEIFLGEAHYALVKVPPGVWNGFKGIGTDPAYVANCASIPHDPDEVTRLDPINNDVIDYDWALQHR